MKQRGFTLLEMVIGMALLGFVLLLLFSGLRLGSRSWDAGERITSEMARQVAITNFLHRQLSLVYPFRWKKDGQAALAFDGEQSHVYFVAAIPAHLGPGGLQLLVLEETRDRGGSALRLRWQSPSPETKEFVFPDESSEVYLLRDLETFEISYFGSSNPDTEPSWHASWTNEARLPKLVRVKIATKNGKAWPEIVAALKLESDADCRWDSFTRRCM